MKRISKIILSLLCIIGFASSVDAASYVNSITTSTSSTQYEYVTGLPVYYNTASSYNLYVLNYGTYYGSRTTLTDPVQANSGFAYIVSNSNVTSNSSKNYYIAQIATLWYQDYLNGNDANISSSMKEYINSNTNDTVCYYIVRLVNAAKNNSNNESISFVDKSVTWTKNGSYYYSNVIDVYTNNLSSTPTVRLYNAPTSATIVNSSVTRNGNGSFQIRIPASSLSNFREKDFEVYITASGSNNVVYRYSNYGSDAAIYARTYSSSSNNIEASLPVYIKGIDNTSVRISILDNNGNYIKGLNYSIYSGDCTNSTCYSDNLVETITTKNSYTNLNNVLSSGTYTLVNKSNSNRYNLPSKTRFEVTDTSDIQYVTVEEDNYYNYDNYNNYNNNNYNNNNYKYDSTRQVNFYNRINDSSDIIKIYSNSGVLVASYRSNETNYSIRLGEGTYYVVDTNNKFDKLYFKITSSGELLVKYDDRYVESNYVNLDKNSYESSIITDDEEPNIRYDEDTNTYYVDGIDGIISLDIDNNVDTNTDVQIEWLSNIIDCPITSVSSTIKYVIGAIIMGIGAYLVVRNVKKNKNNI